MKCTKFYVFAAVIAISLWNSVPGYCENVVNAETTKNEIHNTSDSKKEVNFYIERGINNYYNGNLDAALQDLLQAVRLDQSQSVLYNNIAMIYWRKNEFGNALDYINEAIRIDKENSSYYFTKGTLLNSLGKFGEAEDALKISIDLDPQNVSAFKYLGTVLINSRKYDDAIYYITQGINIYPYEPMLHLHRAMVHELQGEYDKAKKDVDAAFSYKNNLQDMDDYAFYNYAGNIYKSLGYIERALECYEISISLNKSYVPGLLGAAQLYMEKGDLETAYKLCHNANTIATFDGSMARNPNLVAIARTELGYIFYQWGDYEKALNAFQYALVYKSEKYDQYSLVVDEYAKSAEDCIRKINNVIELKKKLEQYENNKFGNYEESNYQNIKTGYNQAKTSADKAVNNLISLVVDRPIASGADLGSISVPIQGSSRY